MGYFHDSLGIVYITSIVVLHVNHTGGGAFMRLSPNKWVLRGVIVAQMPSGAPAPAPSSDRPLIQCGMFK